MDFIQWRAPKKHRPGRPEGGCESRTGPFPALGSAKPRSAPGRLLRLHVLRRPPPLRGNPPTRRRMRVARHRVGMASPQRIDAAGGRGLERQRNVARRPRTEAPSEESDPRCTGLPRVGAHPAASPTGALPEPGCSTPLALGWPRCRRAPTCAPGDRPERQR